MNLFRHFISYLSPYRLRLALTLLASLLFSIFSAASVYMILPIMNVVLPDPAAEPVISTDNSGFLDSLKAGISRMFTDLLIVEGSPTQSLLNLCILVVIIFLLKNFFKFVSSVTNTRIQLDIMKDIRDDLFSRSVRLPLSFYNRNQSGELISIVTNEVSTINAAFVPTLVKITRDPIQVITLLVLLLALSPTLTLIAFSTSILTVLLIRLLRDYIRRYSIRMQSALQQITVRLQETFQNIRIIKGYAAERFEEERFHDETIRYNQSAVKHSIVDILSGPISEIIAILALAIVLFYGGSQVLAGTMKAEELIAFLLLLFSIMTPVVSVFQIPTNLQRGIVAAERVQHLLHEAIEDSNGTRQIDRQLLELRFQNVSFAYRSERQVLRNINLTIRSGETVALVGPSGGGKSTLMDLLIRFYDPVEGCVALNGTDIREFNLQSYRSLFGVVTQESLLFNDTVRNNIAYAMPDVTDAEVASAAATANAASFIEQLPDGYQTVIGDRGVTLSGGQRQRLAIARSIVRSPEVLLFDEATSALDTESELLVQKAIENILVDRTAIIIAHRLSTIRNADRIIVIDRGTILEEGNHQELLQKKGLYHLLYTTQFSTDAETEEPR